MRKMVVRIHAPGHLYNILYSSGTAGCGQLFGACSVMVSTSGCQPGRGVRISQVPPIGLGHTATQIMELPVKQNNQQSALVNYTIISFEACSVMVSTPDAILVGGSNPFTSAKF